MYMNVDDGGAQDESLWVGGSGKVKGRVKGGGRKRTPKLPGIKGGPKTGPTANVALAN
jgi:hypothetical protein